MFYFKAVSASLRTRLILIPPIFLLLGIMAAIIAMLVDAPGRVALETASGVTIGSHLIDYALEDIKFSADPDSALDRLLQELAHVRHIRVGYRSAPSSPITKPITPLAVKEAPAWFVNLFQPKHVTETFPIIIEGQRRGELVMSAQPADEVGEVWDELVFLIGLLSAISAGIISLIWLSTSYALHPLRDLVQGLDRLERGQFGGLGEIRVAELRRVGEQFNRLAKSLAQTEADNRLLIDRLMSIQESERKELARELHDEFGASLFGIRAAASCIVEATSADGPVKPRFKEIADRADAISTFADAIQKHNYRILERIQPIALNQVGFFDALHHLVQAWRTAHRDFLCELETPDEQRTFGEDVSLTIYRVVQECLTNVARHSKAKNVQIAIKISPDQSMFIRVADDGVGLSRDFRFGFGFLGMSERVRKLNGRLKVSNGRKNGTLIEVTIPSVERPIAKTGRTIPAGDTEGFIAHEREHKGSGDRRSPNRP
jgi:two-component system sensor histidine kinase UhpB